MPAPAVHAIILDIEGTTTPIAFVTTRLFPYARTHLTSYLNSHRAACADVIDRLRAEHHQEADESPPSWSDAPEEARIRSATEYVDWLMDRDRKSPALKELQGRIWKDGYRSGELIGEVFPDVPVALGRWHRLGIPVGIFSSGSVLAQQLLFRHSAAGDLTRFLRWHFDTAVGAKGEPESYRRIASAVDAAPEQILFVSDIVRELDAARAAGMQTRLSERPGNATPPKHHHPVVRTFDQIP
ncbi:MAG: acireductone synthase [Acidobacteria bacterium]|nr:MAG: acireductone synthase [Acidobacteriota bacterium]